MLFTLNSQALYWIHLWGRIVFFCLCVCFDPVYKILLDPTLPQLMALVITFSKDRLQVRFDPTSVV